MDTKITKNEFEKIKLLEKNNSTIRDPSIISKLPEELKNFLGDEENLFWVNESKDYIGPSAIALFPYDELPLIKIIQLQWGSPDDPNVKLNGYYEILAIDFVKKSTDYYPKGLLVWIPYCEQFGVYDNDVNIFLLPKTLSWEEIFQSPLLYINEQWSPKHCLDIKLQDIWDNWTFIEKNESPE